MRLATTHWHDEPTVEFNLLSDKRDLDRLTQGFRKVAKLYEDPAMQVVTSNVFPASYSDKVRQVGLVNKKNEFLTNVMAKLLDGRPDAPC